MSASILLSSQLWGPSGLPDDVLRMVAFVVASGSLWAIADRRLSSCCCTQDPRRMSCRTSSDAHPHLPARSIFFTARDVFFVARDDFSRARVSPLTRAPFFPVRRPYGSAGSARADASLSRVGARGTLPGAATSFRMRAARRGWLAAMAGLRARNRGLSAQNRQCTRETDAVRDAISDRRSGTRLSVGRAWMSPPPRRCERRSLVCSDSYAIVGNSRAPSATFARRRPRQRRCRRRTEMIAVARRVVGNARAAVSDARAVVNGVRASARAVLGSAHVGILYRSAAPASERHSLSVATRSVSIARGVLFVARDDFSRARVSPLTPVPLCCL